MQIFGEQKSNENGIFCENRRMTSDIMDGEGAAFAKRRQLPRRKKMPSGRRRYYKEYMAG